MKSVIDFVGTVEGWFLLLASLWRAEIHRRSEDLERLLRIVLQVCERIRFPPVVPVKSVDPEYGVSPRHRGVRMAPRDDPDDLTAVQFGI